MKDHLKLYCIISRQFRKNVFLTESEARKTLPGIQEPSKIFSFDVKILTSKDDYQQFLSAKSLAIFTKNCQDLPLQPGPLYRIKSSLKREKPTSHDLPKGETMTFYATQIFSRKFGWEVSYISNKEDAVWNWEGLGRGYKKACFVQFEIDPLETVQDYIQGLETSPRLSLKNVEILGTRGEYDKFEIKSLLSRRF